MSNQPKFPISDEKMTELNMNILKNKTVKTDPKVVFRRSKAWKTFRENLKKSQKKDPVTSSRLAKNCNCHHLDQNPKNYSDLSDESHFICLNNMTHEIVHFLWGDSQRRYDWKTRLKKLAEICQLMDEINDVTKK